MNKDWLASVFELRMGISGGACANNYPILDEAARHIVRCRLHGRDTGICDEIDGLRVCYGCRSVELWGRP